MIEEKEPEKNGNGMKHLIQTLLSSGDNWTKAIIIGGLVLNTWFTKNNGSGIDALHQQVAREVRYIYDQQRHYVEYINLARLQHDAIMEKLNVPHPKLTPIPIPTPPEELK